MKNTPSAKNGRRKEKEKGRGHGGGIEREKPVPTKSGATVEVPRYFLGFELLAAFHFIPKMTCDKARSQSRPRLAFKRVSNFPSEYKNRNIPSIFLCGSSSFEPLNKNYLGQNVQHLPCHDSEASNVIMRVRFWAVACGETL